MSDLRATSSRAKPPIFILSPLPRCGTNFLWDVLRQHPHCSHGRPPIWEDYLLKNSDDLLAFVDAAQASWDPVWGPTDHLRAPLLHQLGDALIRFMTIDDTRRLLTKSPSIQNLEHFFDLFPDAYLLLLVRDGRDVTHSGMATFGWTLDGAARWWAKEIDAIAAFTERSDLAGRHYEVVRYEDLVEDWPDEIERVLKVLDLPVELFDAERAARLPVRGSSTHRGHDEDDVHWDPVPRTEDFRAVGRWRSWDRSDLDAFHEIAGPQLERMGYET